MKHDPSTAMDFTAESWPATVRELAVKIAEAQEPGLAGRLNIAEPDTAGSVSVVDDA